MPTASSGQGNGNFTQTVTTVRIIVGALVMGVMTFTAISVAAGKWNPNQFTQLQILVCLSPLLTFPPALIIPRMIAKAHRKNLPPAPDDSVSRDTFGPPFQTGTIVGAALVEGTAMFAAIAYLLEGHYASLIVAMVCLMALMLFFPLPGRAEEWADEQLGLWKRGE